MMRARSLLSMCMLGLSACAAAPDGPGGPAKPAAPAAASANAPGFAGTRWVGVVDAGVDARAAPRLEFLDGGRLAGFTGCNMMSGAWRMEGTELRMGSIATTKRMCLGPEAQIEKRLVAAMGAEASVRREGTKLVFRGPAGARFEFVQAAP
ncbi:MAG: META domain-containing protein [Usitatibacter sp.]